MNIYSNEAKQYLMENGVNIIRDFCTLNNIKEPTIKLSNFRTTKKCGVYDGRIKVDLSKCAKASNLYSFPNLYVNRTPQGVVTHEFGHYLQDVLKISTRTLTKQYNKINEKPISSYAPNSSEWFAEIIKLFTTNPDLLKLGRPKTYNWLVNDLKLKPLTRGDYINVLKEFNSDLNERIIQRANKFAKIKIKEDKDIIEWSVAFIMKKNKESFGVAHMDVKAKSKEEAEQIVKCEIGEYLEKITGIITKEEDDKFSAFMKNREKRNHKVAYNG